MANFNIDKKVKTLLEEKEKNEKKKKENENQNEISLINSDLSKKGVSDVLSDLSDIEKKYSNRDYVDAADSLGLEKVEVESKTDDEIKDLATSLTKNKYDQKKESTSENFSRQIENAMKQKESAKENSESRKDEINSVFNGSVKSAENQALRRGLARSSVIINQLSEIEGGRAKELSQTLRDLNNKLDEADANIKNLETERDKALSDLDIEYALELQSEIENQKQEYEKRRNEAIEFNNNVDKLEADYKLKLEDQKLQKQKQLTELEDKYGANYTQNLIKDKQMDYLKSYFDSIDTSYAIDIMETNKDFLRILGTYRYNELLSYLKNKQ